MKKRHEHPFNQIISAASLWLLLLAFSLLSIAPLRAEGSSVRPPDSAANEMFNATLSRDWQAIRKGEPGKVSIADKKAAILIQSGGQDWREFRLGTLFNGTVWALAGMVALLAIFYIIRGRIRVAGGMSGRTIERFTFIERSMHWTLAISFIVLALTGLNLIYGRSFLLPIIGGEAFASLTIFGKWLHNFMGFAFMIALVWTFVSWVAHNIPSAVDAKWIAEGGGIIGDRHPPARKFNAGQKIIFWLVILGGFSLSLSGLALMMPFEWQLFSHTNGLFNLLGFNLPTNLTVIEEAQLAQMWHAIMAVFMIAVILAHIYIGTIGMEGAFDAMSDGRVDENWAREHHSLWVEEVQRGETKS